MPVFLELTADEIWGVRKACAESIVPIAMAASPEVRVQKLIGVYEGLIKDVCVTSELGNPTPV